MRIVVTALVSAAFVAGLVGTADAAKGKKKYRSNNTSYNAPSAVAKDQRLKRTFDDTQYYERLSEKIPFGTHAWWRQKELEAMW